MKSWAIPTCANRSTLCLPNKGCVVANNFVKLEERLAMAFFAATSIFVLIGAATRTAGIPVIWAVDLAQLCFAWACVLGADLALKKNTHIEIDIVVRYFSKSVRKYLAVAWLIAIAFFLGFLVWYGTKLSLQNVERLGLAKKA